MTDTANHLVPQPGKFRRALVAIWTTLEAMSSSSGIDYTLDRIERLEREMGRLGEEIRQIRGAEPPNSPN